MKHFQQKVAKIVHCGEAFTAAGAGEYGRGSTATLSGALLRLLRETLSREVKARTPAQVELHVGEDGAANCGFGAAAGAAQ